MADRPASSSADGMRSDDGGRIRHTGTVLAVQEGLATVRLDRAERCHGCLGCGIDDGHCITRIADTEGLEPGDVIVLGASAQAAAAGAFFLFGLPLGGAVLGGILGERLAVAAVDSAAEAVATIPSAVVTAGTALGIAAGLIAGALPFLVRRVLQGPKREELQVERLMRRDG